MAFFRTVNFNEPVPSIDGAGVFLRAPQPSDFVDWAELREASRGFLAPWEPTWPADDLTRAAFRRRLRRYSEDQRADLAYAFFVFRAVGRALVGGLTLGNIRRGVAQAGSIGYWMGAAYARQGHMSAAVRACPWLRHPAAASGRGGMHSRQYPLDPAPGAGRLQPRGLCAGVPVH